MQRRLSFIFGGLLLLLCRPSFAGLFLCNQTAHPINAAVGYNENGGWVSRGWFVIQPRNCALPIAGALTNKYYYYYAETNTGKSKWSPSSGAHFCTTTNAFYLKSDSDDCEGALFMKVDAAGSERFVVNLIEGGDPVASAMKCDSERSAGLDGFSKCWMSHMATEKQRQIIECVDQTSSKASLAICAASKTGAVSGDALRVATCSNTYNQDKRGDQFLSCIANGHLSDDQARLFQCAVDHSDFADIATCAAAGALSPEQRRIVACAADNHDSYVSAGLCAAQGQLTADQRRIAGCVLNNSGSYMQMGVCAAGANLTPEQQIFANCAISTGGQPYAFAGCVGTQLTANELQKCMTDGIGGDGCFGNNNTIVKFATNAWSDVTRGPGPNNDLLGRDGFVGRNLRNAQNDLRYGPGPNNDVVGRDGFLGRTVRNAGNDIQNGPSNTNDLVGKDGWACRTLFGGC